MFKYNKFLQFPINIRNKNPRLANIVATQYGGPNGEIGASLRYLSQRYTMPDDVTKGLLTDIGVEELGHLEMVGTLVKQLSKGEPADEWTKMGSWEYYADIFVIIETNRKNSVISRIFGLVSFHFFR